MLTASAALGASVNPDLAQVFTEKQAAVGGGGSRSSQEHRPNFPR